MATPRRRHQQHRRDPRRHEAELSECVILGGGRCRWEGRCIADRPGLASHRFWDGVRQLVRHLRMSGCLTATTGG